VFFPSHQLFHQKLRTGFQWICGECQEKFGSPKELCAHRKKHIKQLTPINKIDGNTKKDILTKTCSECNMEFTESKLERHKLLKHPK